MSTVNSDIFLLSQRPSVFAYFIVGKYSMEAARSFDILASIQISLFVVDAIFCYL